MHPLSLFRYCPKCCSPDFRENDFKSKRCGQCGFVYYFNSSASTAAFIVNEKGELLVAQRAKDPAKGTLDLPGGFVDLHESAEEAVVREIREETGLDLHDPVYLFSLPNIYTYSGFEVHTTDLFFQLILSSDTELKADDDVEQLFFLPPEEIRPERFGLDSIRTGVRRWMEDYSGK